MQLWRIAMSTLVSKELGSKRTFNPVTDAFPAELQSKTATLYSNTAMEDGGQKASPVGDYQRFKGCFNSNNGILAIVDNNGVLHLAPHSSELISEITRFGFEKNGKMGVPCSNNDRPASHCFETRGDFARVFPDWNL